MGPQRNLREVIQHIYRKYGRERAALTSTVITYRSKSAIRDVGKAMGFDFATIELISQTRSWWDTPDQLPSQLKSIGLDPNYIHIKRYIYLVNELRGFPRHLSQHTGGFIISEGPLNQLVPIENASMPGRNIVQWDKDDIDARGMMKIDILAV